MIPKLSPRKCLLVHCCNERPNQELYTLILDGNDSFHQLKTFDFPLTSRSSDFFSVVGSCNGLICLSDDGQGGNMDDIYLWNPSIRKSVALPRYNVRVESHGPAMQCLGFGFDSVTDDFKVVRVVHVYEGEGCYWVPPEVEIYTLKTGNWRCISDKALPAMISKRYRQAYVNGAAHWMAYSQATQAAEFQPTILSFDMSGEVFNEILVPDSMDHGGFLLKSMILVVFKESLSLIEQCDCDCDCDYYPRCTMCHVKKREEEDRGTGWLSYLP
ncbi:hypothetical protein Vadar_007198 [Vaccinium darrowii]|uniref:Uncharacterized protein n=1 Tax=Vaccinium darrowii TaxID=229202 RepID=A0ACB7YLY3_9ERIC|nr:hypothetical protein Vadar_007198 [Vaccinium darrowii]